MGEGKVEISYSSLRAAGIINSEVRYKTNSNALYGI
jgi:hypothetical protein